MPAIIEVKDLLKKFNQFVAVNHISFEVQEGEVFGLLGPNGAGKTTTLEILETIQEKTSGTIIIDGYNIEKSPNAIKQIIGVQLQAAGFYPNLNLKEILELFAGLYNTHIDPMAFLEKVNLESKAHNKFKQLSGGQKQRFSIATTLIHQPKIIFLDEPTTGLDPQARQHLWQLILDLKTQGTTIVLTTHYMDEAEYLCDRIAIMDEGSLIALDTPSNLVDQLLATGFKKTQVVKPADIEDVFLHLTGKQLREKV